MLPIVYLLILAGVFLLKRGIFGRGDPAYYGMNATVALALVGLVVLLWSRRPIPLAGLKALELGMVGLLAGLFAWVQYRVMLASSVGGDLMRRVRSRAEEQGAADRRADPHIRALRPQELAPRRGRRRAAGFAPLRHPRGAGPAAPRGDCVARRRVVVRPGSAGIRVRLRWADPDHPGRRRDVRGPHDLPRLRREVAEGPAARPVSPPGGCSAAGGMGVGSTWPSTCCWKPPPCAVKLIRPAGRRDQPRGALERFRTARVRLTAALSHPNIVEIYDYGRADDGTYYYVMEHLNGLSLAELVECHGVLALGRVVHLLRQVCGALREAHAAGLIHRDIKPSNIFAARRGTAGDVAKLLDFGLVLSRAGSDAAHLSGEGQVLGTPLYMSPEQVRGGRELDGRSDLYSLGAVAYYLLTGHPPFDGEDGIAVMIAKARDPVVPPSRDRADVPEDLERVVLRCLAKDPAERFPDAESLERALADCACAGDWDPDQAAQWWQGTDAGSILMGSPRESLASHRSVWARASSTAAARE